jgi:hypothetical protein
MWQKNVSFGHAQLMGGGSERATLNEKFPNAWIGRADQFPGLPEAQTYPDGLSFCGDTSRTVCMVKRLEISSTYGIGSQR